MSKHAFVEPGFIPQSITKVRGSDLSTDVRNHFKSLRIKNGEQVRILDGKGLSFDLKCTDSKTWSFDILSTTTQSPPHPVLHFYLSPPKSDALSLAVSHLVEVGASSLNFVRSANTTFKSKEKIPHERLDRISMAASAQSGRAYLMEVGNSLLSLEEAVNEKPSLPNFVADEVLASDPNDFHGIQKHLIKFQEFKIFIGPEGGWSEHERQFFDLRSCERFSLGSYVLRVPTACVAAAQIIRLLSSLSRSR